MRDIVVSPPHVYVAAGDAGLQILDASDPTHIRRLGAFIQVGPGGYPGTERIYAVDAEIAGNLALVVSGSLFVVDVSDPTRPRLVGQTDVTGVVDAVAVAGPYVYAASGPDLQVFHLDDDGTPVHIGSAVSEYRRDRESSAADILVTGKHVLVAVRGTYERRDEPNLEGLLVFDVSDPAQPQLRLSGIGGPLVSESIALGSWGDVVYVATGDDEQGRLMTYRITSELPLTMNLVSERHYWGWGGTDLEVIAGYLLMAGADGGLRVRAMSAEEDEADTAMLHTLANPGGVAETGGRLLVSESTGGGPSGLSTLSLDGPRSPVLIASADVPGDALDVTAMGDNAVVTNPHLFDGQAPDGSVFRLHEQSTLEWIGSIDSTGVLRGGAAGIGI